MYLSDIFPDKSLIMGEIRKTLTYTIRAGQLTIYLIRCALICTECATERLDNLHPLSRKMWLGGGIILSHTYM